MAQYPDRSPDYYYILGFDWRGRVVALAVDEYAVGIFESIRQSTTLPGVVDYPYEVVV